MTEARLRTARTEDVEDIGALSAALFEEDAGTRDPFTNVGWPGEEGREHFLRLVRRDGAVCLLAVVEEATVGYLAGYVREPSSLRPVSIAELESMYVLEDYRGQGLGERLVDRFCAWALERGSRRVSVTAYSANEGALRFYERVGFEPKSVSFELAL